MTSHENAAFDGDRLLALLDGAEPALSDFAAFVSVVEQLPVDLLWEMSQRSPSLNHTLRSVLDKQLVQKIGRTNCDRAIDGIVTRMKARFDQKALT
ncbi:hypothetical protein [Aquimonas sp.]|jgi:hypothetical protein|uniref:hypothetical protein n=1 Tax=Aquimonas sp. TaxID=1872588 RepID=UPI0037BED6BC